MYALLSKMQSPCFRGLPDTYSLMKQEPNESPERSFTRSDVERTVREIIQRVLLLEPEVVQGIDLNRIGQLAHLGVSSIDTFELIISVEEQFGFEFSDHELTPELVDPLNKFISAICQKIEATT